MPESRYPTFMRASFSNQAYRREMLSRATVHVAVGFVDLGMLLTCELNAAPSGRHAKEPLRFVGIEMSAYAVAKSLVVWQMILEAARGGETTGRAVMQVWYSACWEPATERAFRAAARAVRSRSSVLYESNAEVSRLIEHWAASRGVSVGEARAQWAARTTDRGGSIADMARRRDRLEMARYEITGDVFVSGARELCGSICWWDCPDGTPPSMFDETFLSAVDPRLTFGMPGSAPQGVIRAAETFLLSRLDRLIAWARAGAVTVEARVGDIRELVPYVASLQPWTMSWSNVLDYVSTAEFHRIARACSIHGDTIHFAYSMNWSQKVRRARA